MTLLNHDNAPCPLKLFICSQLVLWFTFQVCIVEYSSGGFLWLYKNNVYIIFHFFEFKKLNPPTATLVYSLC